MRRTVLDKWIDKKTNGDLQKWQLDRINDTLEIAQNSPYYREIMPVRINDLSDIAQLPTMSARILKEEEKRLICVRQSEISRIVTLHSSGSTGVPKRVYFTEEDQELTVDFFANGLYTIAEKGQTMLICLPCDREGGVGDLIARALNRMGVKALRFGLIDDLEEAAKVLLESGSEALIGIPVQVRALALYCEAKGLKSPLKRILLSTDSLPESTREIIEDALCCEVFDHFGMTEMGLGVAIECDAHDGTHIRENDLYVEILDENDCQLPDGQEGELTFTTLTRKGMPLIRYRTGDIAKLMPDSCACNSTLKRIARKKWRKENLLMLSNAKVIDGQKWDEILFSIGALSDFALRIDGENNELHLCVELQDSFAEISRERIICLLEEAGLIQGLKIEVDFKREKSVLKLHRGDKRILILNNV